MPSTRPVPPGQVPVEPSEPSSKQPTTICTNRLTSACRCDTNILLFGGILMRKAFSLAVLAVAAVVLTQPADASPIIYVESGQLSGTLGGTVLTNVPFTFTFISDTNNIIMGPAGCSCLLTRYISNSIVIGGSVGSFTSPEDAGVNPTVGIIGISDPTTDAFGISFVNDGAFGYDLATLIGPLTNPMVFVALGSADTTLGTLVLDPQGAQNFRQSA